ncbi:MAG: hypothetical protein PVJ89_03570 [Planctomycetota bacterium]|jgi:hypothetical protein
MTLKKRALRLGCIVLLLLSFVGYFSFTTLFFSPFEGRFNADVAGLIPRDVDVYVARAELRSAFDGFPRLDVLDELEGNEGFQTLMDSPEWAEFERENRVEAVLADVRAQLSQLPAGLEVLDVAGGEDLAVAANFTGRSFADAEWAAYARLSMWGRGAVSALDHPGLLGLDAQGITVEDQGAVKTISSPQLARPLHLTRLKDVAVVGTSRDLVERAVQLEATGSKDSLLLAAPYGDSILTVDRDSLQRDFELQFDVRQLRESYGLGEGLLDREDERFAPAFLARLLPLDAVRRVLGVVDFDRGVDVDLSGDFSSERMTAAQERVYRFKGFDHDEVLEVARFAPDDSTLFVYVRGPIATLFEMVVEAIEPAARRNFEEALKQIGVDSISSLIEVLDSSLVDRVAFIARPNDWDYESDMEVDPSTGERVYMGPPNDGAPVFAWAVVAWVSDQEKLEDLRERIALAGPRIGIQGRNPGQSGYFKKPIGGGLFVREFWSQLVPGTGHIASLIYGENLLISNRYALIDALVKNRNGRGSSVPRLSNRRDFQVSLMDSVPSANVLAWLNPASGSSLLRDQAQLDAKNRITRSIDYATKRREVERDVLSRAFGGRARTQLTADDVERLDALVDQQLLSFTDEVVESNMPRELEKVQRLKRYLDSIASALTMVRLSPKDFQLSMRARVPLGSE